MKFKLWTWYHYLYIIAPFLIILALWLLLRKRSEKTKYIVGVVIGVLSLACIIIRNVSWLCIHGFSPEIIPLQVCHFGNIMVFIALIFRSKISTTILWCLNLIAAFSSLIVADSLANYSSFFNVLAQCYFWGHLLIVVGALYAIVLKIVRIDKKSFWIGIGITLGLVFISVILNTIFNDLLNMRINYFYIYDSRGVPFEVLYNLGKMTTIGKWFSLNIPYVIAVGCLGFLVMLAFYFLQKLFYLKDKNYKTYNILQKAKY